MTQHQIGYDVTNECGQEALLNHLQNAFKIDNETHERIMEETQNMEVVFLNCFTYKSRANQNSILMSIIFICY